MEINYAIKVVFFLFSTLVMFSCNIHLLVRDERYVKSEKGYLLFRNYMSKSAEENERQAHRIGEDQYDTLYNVFSTFFIKQKELDTSITKVNFLRMLERQPEIWNLGNYEGRESEILLADTISITDSKVYLILPVTMYFVGKKVAFYSTIYNEKIDESNYRLNVKYKDIKITDMEPVANKIFRKEGDLKFLR